MLAASLSALLAARTSWGAADGSPARIGWLKIQGPHHTPGQLKAFRDGLRGLGLIEGRDYVIEKRYADGHEARLPRLAAELLGRGVHIIVATSQLSIAAAARVTKGVPVIGRMNDDPVVVDGMAKSLARPRGNITGIYAMTEELNVKRLALLKEAVPFLRRVGVLRRDWSNAEHDWRVALAAARTLDLDLLALDARSADDLTAAFDLASANGVDGIMTFRSPTVVTYLKLIAEVCGLHRLPAVFDAREYVEAGGLLSYGPNIDAIYRQLATCVGKLVRGASVAELPIEEPTTFELVINKRTAATIGLTLPSSLLEGADTVIDP